MINSAVAFDLQELSESLTEWIYSVFKSFPSKKVFPKQITWNVIMKN